MWRLASDVLRTLVAAFSLVACIVSASSAQLERTSIQRAAELIADYVEAASRQTDQRARSTLEFEGLAALLMLPGNDRTGLLLQRLDSIGRNAPYEWRIDELNLKTAALDLAVRRGDLVKARALGDAGAKWGDVAEGAAERLVSLDPQRSLEFVDQLGDDVLWLMADNLCRMGRADLARSIVRARPSRPWNLSLYAELGMLPELEQELADTSDPYLRQVENRLGRLVNVAYILARNGDLASAQRIAEQVLAVPTSVSLATFFTSRWRGGLCGWRVPRLFDRFERGSIIYWATPQLGDHDYPDKYSVLGLLAAALVANGPNERSRQLLSRLMTIANAEVERVKIDPAERAELMRQMADRALAAAAERRLVSASSGLAAKHAIALAQFVVGERPDSDWELPDAPTVVDLTIDFPRARLAERVLAESDRLDALKRTDPKTFANLWFNLNVLAGRGDLAREALTIDSNASGLGRVSLLTAAAAMGIFGMSDESRAAVDAYLAAREYRYLDFRAVQLLMVQERRADLIEMLRLGLDSDSHLDRFIAIAMLNDLGVPVEIAPLKARGRSLDAREIVADWCERADALAWLGRSDQIRALIQAPPPELSSLTPEWVDAYRQTAHGLLAVALAREGYLEEALRIVFSRPFNSRYVDNDARGPPAFTVPYLVYQWIARGHADR